MQIVNEEDILNGHKYREMFYTDEYSQVGTMFLSKGDDIEMEQHMGTQYIFILYGSIEIISDLEELTYSYENDLLIIPPKTWHKIISLEETKLLTIYSPPQH